jgi:small-conductance mechanosensitive channel
LGTQGKEPRKETAELSRMEQAAQVSENPEVIKREEVACEKANAADYTWLFVLGGFVAALFAGQVLLNAHPEWVSTNFLPRVRNYIRGAILTGLIVLGARLIEVLAINRVSNPVNRFNLKRILRLLTVIAVVFTIISVLFVNWYAAVVSLGLISLILGFALQTPISSFIGWIYLLVRAPYRVGDRIKIGELRGDVIDVSYLDTTLWEFGGEYLSTDHPSGRIIRIPNANVLSEPVVNYSWPLFPYIWNEVKFQIAYDADLRFIRDTLQRITEAELGDAMANQVQVYRDLLARTPVDHLDVQERPTVMFRVSENTWLEAIVRYLVHPKEAGRVKTRLIEKLLTALNAQPDKALFPKSNMR